MVTRVHIWDKTVSISDSANTKGKGMNAIFLPDIGILKGRLGSSIVVWQPVYEEENLTELC